MPFLAANAKSWHIVQKRSRLGNTELSFYTLLNVVNVAISMCFWSLILATSSGRYMAGFGAGMLLGLAMPFIILLFIVDIPAYAWLLTRYDFPGFFKLFLATFVIYICLLITIALFVPSFLVILIPFLYYPIH